MNGDEEHERRRRELAARVVEDLIPLQEDIFVMIAAISRPPRGATDEEMNHVAERLASARTAEKRAITCLIDLGVTRQQKS